MSRELAHGRMPYRLDVYGECRDNEETEGLELSAWLKEEPCTDRMGGI